MYCVPIRTFSESYPLLDRITPVPLFFVNERWLFICNMCCAPIRHVSESCPHFKENDVSFLAIKISSFFRLMQICASVHKSNASFKTHNKLKIKLKIKLLKKSHYLQ